MFRFPVDFARTVQFVPGGTPPQAAEEESAPTAASSSTEAPSRQALLRRIAEQLSDASSILDAVEAQRQHHRPEVGETYVAPRSPLEASVAEIWSQVLGIDRVGIHDDFFALGGGSLLAVRVFTEIEKRFGQSLPITALLTAPTVEKLARMLENRSGSKLISALVPIQPLGSRPPFFCVHGAMGKVLLFRSLALRLGLDQPYWGLQARDLEDDEVQSITVEGLARQYLDLILAEYPKGPYVLGGLCFGSLVAVEMARMLRERNQEVLLVALFDPPLITVKSFLHYPAVTARGVASRIGGLFRSPLRDNVAFFARIRYNLSIAIGQRWNDVLGRPADRGQEQAGESAGQEDFIPRQIQNIYVGNIRANRLYRPRPYPGPVTVFMAQENSGLRNMISEEEWKTVAQGGVEVHVIPSSHGNFFAEPDVEAFSAIVQACLDRAYAGRVTECRLDAKEVSQTT